MANPFHVTFFNQLQATKQTGTCPKCGASSLEVRTTGPRGEKYVLCCGSVQTVLTGERLKVALQLIADRRAQDAAEARDVSMADHLRDLELFAAYAEGGL